MRLNQKPLLISALTLFLVFPLYGAEKEKTWVEKQGVVAIEAENTSSKLDQWQKESKIDQYTGKGYLVFMGNKPVNGPPRSPLVYKFKITNAGNYHIMLRCAKEVITWEGKRRDDICNDCFIRVEGEYDAPEAKGKKTQPAPLEELKKDNKYFGGKDRKFEWAYGARLDVHKKGKKQPVYNFKAGQTYKLVVSGRSQLFKLDRIVFFHERVNKKLAQDPRVRETIAAK